MAKGAGLIPVDRQVLVEEERLAEGGWFVRPAGRQGRDHREGVSLDAVHLLFDLCDLLLERAVGLLSIAC
jgi:hypothetical protein